MDCRETGDSVQAMKDIAVLTRGADAPGKNAAIRAVTRSARDVGGIIQVGGTFLGSARSAEFREDSGRSKALRNLAQRGIDVVVGPYPREVIARRA